MPMFIQSLYIQLYVQKKIQSTESGANKSILKNKILSEITRGHSRKPNGRYHFIKFPCMCSN